MRLIGGESLSYDLTGWHTEENECEGVIIYLGLFHFHVWRCGEVFADFIWIPNAKFSDVFG